MNMRKTIVLVLVLCVCVCAVTAGRKPNVVTGERGGAVPPALEKLLRATRASAARVRSAMTDDETHVDEEVASEWAALMRAKEAAADDSNTDIIGGSTTTSQEFPWLAALIQWDGDTDPTTAFPNGEDFNSQFCGGTLIHPSFVLTAAHCFCPYDPPLPVKVSLGRWSLAANEGGTREDFISSRVHCHPSYNEDTIENDIALIELNGVSSITPAQVEFSPTTVDLWIAENRLMQVAGWGAVTDDADGQSFPEKMQKTTVPLAAQSYCEDRISCLGIGSTYNDDVMFCAGYRAGGTDSCQGDSGGPFFTTNTTPPTVAGVVSWGIGCALEQLPGVYTYLPAFETWVNNIITCSASCTTNGVCDSACDNAACAWDGGDCVNGVDRCHADCPDDWINNGIYDLTCEHAGCTDPDNTCSASGCTDGVCTPACYNVECNFDDGDCDCDSGCPAQWIGDFECDSVCNNANCGWYDGGDCCPPDCNPADRGDGICDPECNYYGCDWDDGDCDCAPGCPQDIIGNGRCDAACQTSACLNDFGDCWCNPASLCPPCFIGDGYCDSGCTNSACRSEGEKEDCSAAAPVAAATAAGPLAAIAILISLLAVLF